MKLLFSFFAFCLTFSALGQTKQNDLSGRYQNIQDASITTIKKVTETEYFIISPDGKFKIRAKRNGRILSGRLDKMQIECIFNSTYDMIVNKANGKVVFTCKKL